MDNFYQPSHAVYVTLDIAKLLTSVGFNWGCNHYWGCEGNSSRRMVLRSNLGNLDPATCDFNLWNSPGDPTYSAPTLEVAARWLREVKGIALNITAHDGGRYDWHPVYLPHSAPDVYFPLHTTPLFDTYEDALQDALYITLRNITQLNPNTDEPRR